MDPCCNAGNELYSLSAYLTPCYYPVCVDVLSAWYGLIIMKICGFLFPLISRRLFYTSLLIIYDVCVLILLIDSTPIYDSVFLFSVWLWYVGSSSLTRYQPQTPCIWEPGVLATGPRGKSHNPVICMQYLSYLTGFAQSLVLASLTCFDHLLPQSTI